jgi:acyl dehydratase
MNGAAFPNELALRCGPIAAIDLALFAAASGDHNPLHLDTEVARAAGFERPLVHGMLTMACVARLFTQRFGAGCISALETRFTGSALRGDTLEVRASLLGVDAGVARYDVRAVTLNGLELATGKASIALPATASRTSP